MGSYHFLEWQIGRSAAHELTSEEILQFEQEEKEVEKQAVSSVNPKPEIQKQKPSSEIDHKQGEKIAFLVVPKIEQKYSVYWGADKETLKRGVGMYVSPFTTAPDGGGHTVLSGHRDTIFYRLKELKESETLKLEYDNSIYTYKISKIWITDAEDRTVIVDKQTPTLTLTTCYPFYFVGNAPKRYIVQADLVYTENKNNS
ncbi:class D sortase [Neobacillus sp. 179-C4.2 HS]|uniref:Class D sortase n=2 Tax=Neobacillus driksii TaxID=3035913 RepID=A0ABV4YRE0_9BACI|nr:class D sortase [Neobacillus sp. 179.-C4.2 HS]MDP5195001.1 class D sortase [Neobacillus sp. 179.-C4.2 HS]